VEAFAASKLAGSTDIVAEHRVLREFVFLDTFRQQFRQFLNAYGLPTELCDEDFRWHEFLAHYAGVIEDGSLSCTAKGTSLKLVQGVVFTKGTPTKEWEESTTPFNLSWTIVLLDGRRLTVEANASITDDGAMISHSTVLH